MTRTATGTSASTPGSAACAERPSDCADTAAVAAVTMPASTGTVVAAGVPVLSRPGGTRRNLTCRAPATLHRLPIGLHAFLCAPPGAALFIARRGRGQGPGTAGRCPFVPPVDLPFAALRGGTAMGLLDRLFGRRHQERYRDTYRDSAPGYTSSGRRRDNLTDEQAIERYRYLLRTAPPEQIEQAHAEAFSQLTPDQRQQVLGQLAAAVPAGERPRTDDPQILARVATRAELRQPGFLERVFGGSGPGYGPGYGGGYGGGYGPGYGPGYGRGGYGGGGGVGRPRLGRTGGGGPLRPNRGPGHRRARAGPPLH